MARPMPGLFGPRECVTLYEANAVLSAHHYLGASGRGFAYRDEVGVMVFANPSSRRLPQRRWVELVRWCILPGAGANAGSKQWARAVQWLRSACDDVTTVVSYSDPSAGHTGALYRACNWLWAPTWHRLRPPPSGHGRWTETGNTEAVKDRWVFPLATDDEREQLLAVQDDSVLRSVPFASYREPKIRNGRISGGGGDYKQWTRMRAMRNDE